MARDGKELGRVEEVSGSCFKVDAPMAPDYWLGSDCVASISAATVRLNPGRDSLNEAKMDTPEDTGFHAHR